MRYFTPNEFHGWFEFVSKSLLTKLDDFRDMWVARVIISPASGSVGRHLGPMATSQHNIDRWGEVRAVDVIPDGMTSRDSMDRAVNIAKRVGFTGIGVYPHWRPSPGLHLDVRSGVVRTWGGVRNPDGKQVYVSLDEALKKAG